MPKEFTVETPTRDPQVSAACKRLDAICDELHEAANALEGRLSSVLLQELPPSSNNADGQQVGSPMVPLAITLNGFSERLEYTCKQLNTIHRDLEI